MKTHLSLNKWLRIYENHIFELRIKTLIMKTLSLIIMIVTRENENLGNNVFSAGQFS